MGTLDLVIKDGMIVDGLRTPRYRADVGISEGRIVRIGRIDEADADEVLDADGLVVAPGFVDVHTHYDSQLFWDPWCTISPWHGVTTVVIGNCGFGFAPCLPADRERAMLTVARNEAVPIESMRVGMPWDWITFPEFLDSVERTPKGVNVMSYAPLAPIMNYVMGVEEAKQRSATPEERQQICALLEEAMTEGACGFSAQILGEVSVQRDYDGTPMVTDTMSCDDLAAFSRVLARIGRGTVQLTASVEDAELVARESGASVIWNALIPTVRMSAHGDAMIPYTEAIEWMARANRVEGLRIFGHAITTVDEPFEFTLEDWNLYDGDPAWREATLGSVEERLERLADPARRPGLRAAVDSPTSPAAVALLGVPALRVNWVTSDAPPELKRFEGLTVTEIAEMEGKHPVDAMLDLAVAARLQVGWGRKERAGLPPLDYDVLREIVNSEFALPGISDGGAHTKFATTASYGTQFIATIVRDRELMGLEEAHWRLSAYTAQAAGLVDRGSLRPGAPADIIVYDYNSIGVADAERSYDYPAGAWRLTQQARGYRWVLVNGVVTFVDGECTGATPGALLRHGAQTSPP
jgi:N-acyl-D-amino-acid deacylase